MILANNESKGHGVSTVDSHQAGEVPGSLPRRSPPPATGDTSLSSWKARRGSGSINVTGPNIPIISDSSDQIKIAQWNCEGISKKKGALKIFLHKEKIDIACLQETHLNPNLRFLVRGYQCFRQDRPNRHKGGVLILGQQQDSSSGNYYPNRRRIRDNWHYSPTTQQESNNLQLLCSTRQATRSP